MRLPHHSRTGRVLLVTFSIAAKFLHATGSEPPAPDLALRPDAEQRALAYAHLLTARMLEENGSARQALGHYLEFLHLHPGEPELASHIADLAMNYQGIEAAVKLLEDCIRANNTTPDASVNFTQFALTHGDAVKGLTERATVVATEALARFPKMAKVYENAARLHLAQGNRDAAEKIIETAAKQNVETAGFWLDVGRVALEVWPLADGENRVTHLVKVNRFFERATTRAQAAKDEESELRAADYYLFSSQIEQATAICERVVQRSGSLDSRKRLVRLYDALERDRDSFAALQDLVKAFPLDVEHRRLLATEHKQRAVLAARASQLDLAREENRMAVEQLEAALQAGGGDLEEYLELCHSHRFTGEPEKFERFTARAQQLFPGEPRVGYYRGLALSELQRYADAAKAFSETAQLAETRAPALLSDEYYYLWGVALERSGQFTEAAQQLQKSIDLTKPEDLASSESPPRAARTMNYLGYMWLDRGEHLDRAETLIRKANELAPANAAFIDSLGWLFFKQGKYREALASLLESEKLLRQEQPEPEPGDAEILDHIAQTYEKLGRKDDAMAYWKRVLEVKPEIEAIRERAEKALGKPSPSAPPAEPETR
ncbi:MAG: tetratricopeptide repeat protein [Roseimicrobium sp.]